MKRKKPKVDWLNNFWLPVLAGIISGTISSLIVILLLK